MAKVSMEKLLATVIQIKASDLHITVGQPPVVRHHGRHAQARRRRSLDNDDTTGLMKSITPDRCQQELQEKGGADFAIEYVDGVRFRVAVFKQKGTIGMVLRRIPSQFLTFEQLGMPEAIRALIIRPRGLLLVTGPTGSGKTTSLASMINFINDNYDRHIITLEDPIEYFHKHKKCTVNQREIGVDVPDFKEGIRRALRMDPDIILVGEMRDLETIHAAIEAAETGHIVFGTLHTSGAASTDQPHHRRVPEGPAGPDPHAALDRPLIGVLSQALLPQEARGAGRGLRDDGGHARHPEPDPREQDLPHRLVDPDRPQARHVPARRHRCSSCGRTDLCEKEEVLLQVEQAGRTGGQDRPGRDAASTTTRRTTTTRTRTTTMRTRTTTTTTTTTIRRRPASQREVRRPTNRTHG